MSAFGVTRGRIRAMAQSRLDVGNVDLGFIVTHGCVSGGVVYRHACNARHFANPMFHSVHAQYR
jgi:hypothetical protein